MIRGALLGLAIAGAALSAALAQSNKLPAVDEVIVAASSPPSAYTADVRVKFAQSVANYCQAILEALPTNTPSEEAWVIAEGKSRTAAKIQRLINSKEYGRSALKATFAECKQDAEILIQIQQLPNKTATDSRLEAGQFIQLAINFNTFLEPYSSKVELNKDVKFAVGDLPLHIIRLGLLRAAHESLQDLRQ